MLVTDRPTKRSHPKLWRIWNNLHSRVRGQIVDGCGKQRWLGLEIGFANWPAFAAWALATGWAPGLSPDRRDETQGYTPDNIQWLTHLENSVKAHGIHKPDCACFRCANSRRGGEPGPDVPF